MTKIKNAIWIILVLTSLTVFMSCGERDEYYNQAKDWSGPYVLDNHVFYLDSFSGKVKMLDPRDDKDAVGSFMLEDDAEIDTNLNYDSDFKYLLTFPDKTKLVFVSEVRRKLYIVDDKSGEVAFSIDKLPIEFNSFAFSPDKKLMIAYFREDTATLPENNVAAKSYKFKQSGSILANTHSLLVVNLENNEVSLPTLEQNDVGINSISFIDKFMLCTGQETCDFDEATQFERVVALGDSRLWIFDPADIKTEGSDIIPLSISGYSFKPKQVRTSANLSDKTGENDGIDKAEVLFVQGDQSKDIVAINMLYDEEKQGISYSINKLGLSFIPSAIMPYQDQHELYLLALDGNKRAASVHVDSARINLIALPIKANKIRKYLADGNRQMALLYGSNGLVMMNLVNLAVFGDKNITSVDFNFMPEQITFSMRDTQTAIALNIADKKLTSINLSELADSNLKASTLSLTAQLSFVILDEDRIFMLSNFNNYEEGMEESTRIYILPLSGQAELQVDILAHSTNMFFMRGEDKEDDLLLLEHYNSEGLLSAISTDLKRAFSYGGFLVGDDIF